MKQHNFADRHIGPRVSETQEMLQAVGAESFDQLIGETIPQGIRLDAELNLPPALSESEYLAHMESLGAKNKVFNSYIGLGYYGTFTPPVIQRNVLENPGWYTAYTPYQAEIAQGRLEALLNYQTMVIDLTGLELANASLLDEGTAGAEAMILFYNTRSRDAKKRNANKVFVSKYCFPQTIDVIEGRAIPLDIEVVVEDPSTFNIDNSFFGAILQYPDVRGEASDFKSFTENAHNVEVKVAVAADLLALTMLTPPGEWGADVAFGNTQRFGVPMGYGGPHAAYFATMESYKRHIPGRIIGVSVDRQGNPALRMALQTREQHIRRDKATSNICTAQALLAVMAGMYAVWHGPDGLKAIAQKVHAQANLLGSELSRLGYSIENKNHFDTLTVGLNSVKKADFKALAEEAEINVNYLSETHLSVSLDETVTASDLNALINLFAKAMGKEVGVDLSIESNTVSIDASLLRSSKFLTHPVFNTHRSETEMMRYLKKLENRDLSLVHSMIPLGSCTMKLNAAAELMPITWPEFASIHPFAPVDQTQGYQQLFTDLDAHLSEITGFAKVSLQPNSGAQGEYAGLMTIRAYHIHNGDANRNIVLIPSSAHGTNPASAVMAGMEVVVVKCDEKGNIDLEDLQLKADKHKDNLAALMVTYPSTHGVYEEGIREVTGIVHDNGGQVYMDGANMNAQCGLTNPGNIGADVCHLNLHKTFAIPHGGGGPGMGPIGVAAHLAPFLPSNAVIATGGEHGIKGISAAPWGSALILLISYGYIKMLGAEGITDSTRYAILNANYLKARLQDHYDVLYTGTHGRVAHEMIVDCRDFKRIAKIEVEDIAKRLMDYGFHAPTVSFPVAGTLMIEPTESEPKAELDRFADAMLSIRNEITAIAEGKADEIDNVLKNAPHTVQSVVLGEWNHPYTREAAAMPLDYIKEAKFWPSVGRVDNAYGDRNLVCACLPMEAYMEPEEINA